MFVSENYATSLILGIVTMLCWGSNMNACKNLPYPVAYYNLDFVIWCFIWMVVLCLIFGLSYFPPDFASDIFSNLKDVLEQSPSVWIYQIVGPCLAGATNIGTQIIQFATIDAVGLSSGIPLLFGIAMVIGAILTYLVSQSGNFALILSGVSVDFIGVIFNTVAYSFLKPAIVEAPPKSPSVLQKQKVQPSSIKNDEEKKDISLSTLPNDCLSMATMKDKMGTSIIPTNTLSNTTSISENKTEIIDNSMPIKGVSPVTINIDEKTVNNNLSTSPSQPPEKKGISTCKLLTLCIIGAICNSCWGPFSAFASKGDVPLSAYGSMFLVTFAQVIFVFPLNVILMKCPLSGKKSSWKNWFTSPFKYRWPAIWSAFLFSFGCIAYASSGSFLGYATSYALSRGIMLVAALWGLLYYHEFKNAGWKSWLFESVTLICYVVGTLLICFSS